METTHRDPYVGAQGHYDGTDVTLLLQKGPPKSATDRREIQEIYGDIFGDEKPLATARKPPKPKSQK